MSGLFSKIIVLDKEFYTSMDGRISREQFLINWWLPVLIGGLISIILGSFYFLIPYIYATLLVYPAITLGVRRLHDRGKSGWWQLIVLTPLLGFAWYYFKGWHPALPVAVAGVLWYIYELILCSSNPKPSQYGSVPDHPVL